MNKLVASIEEHQADTLPASQAQIEQAERELGITFSQEYRGYLLSAGVLSYESQETYGLGVAEDSHLNIITALKDFRSIKGFPVSYIPLVDIGDGHYYIYDNATQKVLSIALPDLGTREVSTNMEDFLNGLIFG